MRDSSSDSSLSRILQESLDVTVALEAKLLNLISITMALGYYTVEGPWGGAGGKQWTDGTYGDIKRITLKVGDVIDSIQVQYQLLGRNEGMSVNAPLHGGEGGSEVQIAFTTSGEYVTKIKGTTKNYYGNIVVTSLTIISNVKTYGPYGKGGGDTFESKGDGKIVGFHGRAGDSLDQIGVYTYHF
uniref:Jacalin-type lectin domain-containing protein n=2 Tax=Araucaria cunninghamii TaxID=56994 RepID=A0A0D6QXY8_ARACU